MSRLYERPRAMHVVEEVDGARLTFDSSFRIYPYNTALLSKKKPRTENYYNAIFASEDNC